jgi:hypothetical protein
VLRQVARKAQHALRQAGPLVGQRRFGIEAAFGKAVQQFVFAVEPVMRLGHLLDDGQVHAERLAGIAQRAPGPVADHGGGQRGAVAPVLRVDVLDHFFAALVFEVDIDVQM